MKDKILEEHIIKIKTFKNGSKVFFDGIEQNLFERFIFDKTQEGIPGIELNFKNESKKSNYGQLIEEHEIKLEIYEKESKIFFDERKIIMQKKFSINEPSISIPIWFKDGKIIKSPELQAEDLCNIR